MILQQLTFVLALLCNYIATVVSEASPCTTPNGENAFCDSLYNCPSLLQALGTLEPTVKEFVRKSECGYFLVCCGTVGTFTNLTSPANGTTTEKHPTQGPTVNPRNAMQSKVSLVANKKYCGLQHTDDRFNDSSSIANDEFPWLVLLRDPQDTDRACSGALINTKYVLTAATCFVTIGNISIVHLGVFNKEKTVVCTDNPFYIDCTSPVVEVGIEKVIIHEDYDWNVAFSPDIVLVRMSTAIQYSDFIRPICLPFDWSQRPRFGSLLVTSGWGPLNRSGRPVDIKKRVWHRITLNRSCPFVDHLICTFIETNKTNQACGNDFGGPLMYSYKHQWFIEGILSAGVGEPCGQTAVSLRVTKYMDWIFNHIEP